MGRYDKIRVYNGSSWVQPNRMYVYSGSGWVDFGTNTSYTTRNMYVRNLANTAWVRQTLNRQDTTHYGDKHAYQNSGGYLSLGGDSVFNLNQNVFLFQATVKKDYPGDRVIASFKGSTNVAGWSITWLTDGRIRWETKYGGKSYYSYSSNYLPATNTYYPIQIYFSTTGTGSGTITWNGVNSTANRYGRHQYSSFVLKIGVHGTSFKGALRCQGINSSGTTVNRTGDIDNLAVSSSNQSSGSLSTVNTTVTQDSWTTTAWV